METITTINRNAVLINVNSVSGTIFRFNTIGSGFIRNVKDHHCRRILNDLDTIRLIHSLKKRIVDIDINDFICEIFCGKSNTAGLIVNIVCFVDRITICNLILNQIR